MMNLLFLNMNGFELVLFTALLLAYPVLVLYCLVDIIHSSFKDFTTKLLWIIVIFCAPFIGSLLYLKVGKASRVAQA